MPAAWIGAGQFHRVIEAQATLLPSSMCTSNVHAHRRHKHGMSHILEKHIVTSFGYAAPNMVLQLNPDYRTVLNYAPQTVTATIVNAKADYLINEHATIVEG